MLFFSNLTQKKTKARERRRERRHPMSGFCSWTTEGSALVVVDILRIANGVFQGRWDVMEPEAGEAESKSEPPRLGSGSGAKPQPTSLAESFTTPRSSKRCRSRWVPPNGQFEGLSRNVRCLLSTISSRPIHRRKCRREAVAVPKLCPNAIISIHLSWLLSESRFPDLLETLVVRSDRRSCWS